MWHKFTVENLRFSEVLPSPPSGSLTTPCTFAHNFPVSWALFLFSLADETPLVLRAQVWGTERIILTLFTEPPTCSDLLIATTLKMADSTPVCVPPDCHLLHHVLHLRYPMPPLAPGTLETPPKHGTQIVEPGLDLLTGKSSCPSSSCTLTCLPEVVYHTQHSHMLLWMLRNLILKVKS